MKFNLFYQDYIFSIWLALILLTYFFMFSKILFSCRNEFYIISEKDTAQIQTICGILNVKR